MRSILILLALIPSAPNPGFEARFHSPHGQATLLKHFDVWSDQAMLVSRSLLEGSQIDADNLFVDNPNQKRFAIQRNYRESVSREHLVITFYDNPADNIIKTKNGDIALLEIVIGLSRVQQSTRFSLDKIYTVDEEGRIHQHLQPDDGKRKVFNEFIDGIVQAKSQQ